jgi:hypothetical protein
MPNKGNSYHGQGEHSAAVPDKPQVTEATLQELGIMSRQQTSYEWGGFRYTNALDAVAAAKRARQ